MNVQNVQDIFNQMIEDSKKGTVSIDTIQKWMNGQLEDIKKQIK